MLSYLLPVMNSEIFHIGKSDMVSMALKLKYYYGHVLQVFIR